MSQLTEQEIADCLKTNFRLAIEHCRQLAELPARGPTYIKFRAELKLIEGACLQMAYWRDGQSEWMTIRPWIAEAHRRAGNWLRKHYPRPLFLKLAEALEFGLACAERIETRATGKLSGPILPTPLEGPHRDTRPVQVLLPPKPRLILPSGMMLH